MEDKKTQAVPTHASNPTGKSGIPPKKNRMYPEIIIPNNTHPNKLYAFPVIGLAIKFIMLIPAYIIAILLSFVYGIFWIITPFVILFTGKYWNTAYNFVMYYFIYTTKIQFFLMGITDKYPGFSLETSGIFELHLPKPESPSRFLGFPLLGLLIRIILLIPYYIYQAVLQYGMYIATVASWFGVWIKGTYPESLYEFNKDFVRVQIAYGSYLFYLSDTYPSFHISLNHKKIKILLIVLGIAFAVLDLSTQINNDIKAFQNPPAYNNASGSNPAGSDQ